jgi:LPS sulfotransferase NodH
VTRRDKVRQAVSLWRALQTRTWRLEHPGEDQHTAKLRYRFEGIDHLARSLRHEDRAWSEYFRGHAILPVTVVYEDDLEGDRARTVSAVLGHLGLAAPVGWDSPVPIHRQADDLNEEWVDAYHRDLEALAPRASH